MLRPLTIALLITFVALILFTRFGHLPLAEYLPVFVIAALGILVLLTYIFRNRDNTPEFSPFAVYATMLLFAAAAIGIIYLFSRVPPLLFAAITAGLCLLTLILTVRRNERQRLHREVGGFCIECGYDLRQSTERCPECGTDLPEELQRRRRIAAELSAARKAIPPPDGAEM